MYIHKKEPHPQRGAIIVAVIAFAATLLVVFGYAFIRQPENLAAAFTLPDILTRTPTPLGQIEPTITPTFTPTRRPTNTRTPTATYTPMATVAPTATPYTVVEHFMLGRPVLPDASSNIPERSYLYGTTGHGEYEVHHGEEFVNPIGTTLVAVADATVVVAGNDLTPQCGAGGNELCGRVPDYYGNVVILKLDEKYDGRPLFATYGHMSRVDVRPGQHVQAGETLGAVGQEGIAIGPHVHFEVRYGENSYAATRNAILWMKPLPGTGVLAGRLLDRQGKPIRSMSISLYADDEEGTYIYDTETYSHDAAPAVNSDQVLQENWTMPDVPAGTYIVRAFVGGLIYSRRVTVLPGKINFVVFGG